MGPTTRVGENVYELAAHAVSHLIPGDQLWVEDGVAVREHQLRPIYVLEVFFRMHVPRTDVERIVAQWATQCEATMDSDLTCVLVSTNIGYLAWVVIRAGTAARGRFDRAARDAGFTPRVRFETESYDVAQALVGTGYGVALVSRLALNRLPGTTHRPLAGFHLQRTLHTATPTEPDATPLVADFLDLLEDVARDVTRAWIGSR